LERTVRDRTRASSSPAPAPAPASVVVVVVAGGARLRKSPVLVPPSPRSESE
jgi:hypothetical protein